MSPIQATLLVTGVVPIAVTCVFIMLAAIEAARQLRRIADAMDDLDEHLEQPAALPRRQD